MNDLRDWIASIPIENAATIARRVRDDREDPIFGQLEAVRDERVERGDPSFWPPGRDPENLERLVEDRRRRGVLRPRPERRTR